LTPRVKKKRGGEAKYADWFRGRDWTLYNPRAWKRGKEKRRKKTVAACPRSKRGKKRKGTHAPAGLGVENLRPSAHRFLEERGETANGIGREKEKKEKRRGFRLAYT